MSAWRDVEHAEPAFAARVRARFDAGRHKTIATLRADGSPRISGHAVAAPPAPEGPDADRFTAEITEVVHTHLNEPATLLVVEWWTPGKGLQRIARA